MSYRAWIAAFLTAGLVLLTAGLLLGMLPSGVTNADCGSPWFPGADDQPGTVVVGIAPCAGAFGNRGWLGLGLAVVGGVALVGAGLVAMDVAGRRKAD